MARVPDNIASEILRLQKRITLVAESVAENKFSEAIKYLEDVSDSSYLLFCDLRDEEEYERKKNENRTLPAQLFQRDLGVP